MFESNKVKLFTVLGLSLLSFEAMSQDYFKQVEKDSKGTVTFATIDQSKLSAGGRMEANPNILRNALGMKAEDELRVMQSETDDKGFTHEKHQQYYKGVKVEYGTYTTHAQKGLISIISGDFKKVADVSTSPALDEKTALKFAMKNVGAESYMWQSASEEAWLKESTGDKNATFMPKGELVICEDFTKGDGTQVLAYKFNIYAQKPVSRDYIYVNATTGEVIHKNAIIKHVNVTGTAATRYSGTRTITTDQVSATSYRLRETTRGLGIETYNMQNGTNYAAGVDFTDSDNNWSDGNYTATSTTKDNAALDAHWGAAVTYDYWKNTHSRNSYDNAGAKIKSYVHFNLIGLGYPDNNNAFWNGSVMTYGDGSGTGGFNVLTALDVCGHEIGHAICEKTANLAYQKESGAMNEGFSDIWGACIEAYGKTGGVPNANTWLIGENIEMRSGKVALRSMSNPNANSQPDTYGGTYWKVINCGTPANTNDYCGVHTNSGVLNYWFYLLSVGGSGTNDIGSAFSVTGVTMDKAAKIAYRTESVYLSANSTFASARTGSIQAATDLYGAASAEVIATTKAWYAVGVGADYGTVTPPAAYCASKGNSVADEWIGTVKLMRGTTTVFNNVSGKNAGYGNFTATSYAVGKGGAAYTITITPAWTATAYAEGMAVWIDYNRDNDFLDAGELVYSRAASTATPASGSFTIPTTAGTGTTRMRVSQKYNGIPTSCETFSYGEVEDYTLNLGGAAFAREDNSSIAEQNGVNSYNIYPNPASDVLNVQFDNLSENATVRILSISGAEVYSNKTTGKAFGINVSGLSKGLYIISIADENRVINHKFIKE